MKCKNIECEKETIGERIYCSLTCRNVYVNKYLRDYSKYTETCKKKKKEKEIEYLKNPKICENCGNLLDFDRYGEKFCNHSCSASFTNKHREVTWQESISNGVKNYIEKNGYFGAILNKKPKIISEKICPNCSSSFFTNNKFCSQECRRNYNRKDMDEYKAYRSDTMFKFNLADYPDEFDFNLVKEHGWYSPTNKNNNLNGVSRDHMLSVREGFELGIDPKLISHPANCRLMIHNENISKNKNSSITYEELLERIKVFEEKYGGWDCSRSGHLISNQE